MDILRMALYERIQHGKLEQKTITPETNKTDEESAKIEERELLPTPSHELNSGTHVLDEPEHELPPTTHELAQNNHTDEKISEFSPENFLKKIQEM